MNAEIIKRLDEKHLLIEPEKIDKYLENFKNYESNMKKDLTSEEFWSEKRVLITGINGFAGSHLTEKLLEFGSAVVGLVRRHAIPDYKNISHVIDKIKIIEGNLTDFPSLLTTINKFEPNVIFHLGAQSFVPTSISCPIETYETNIIGTANLLEAIRASKSNVSAVMLACSSEEYGMVYPDEVPIKETNPLRPLSPYAVSKVATEILAQVHHKTYGIPTIITRAFNHAGPRRGPQFVTSVICRQIAKASLTGSGEIWIGNTEPIRDFTDVRDTIQGYLLAVEKGRKAEPYNIGHGFGISIGNLIKLAAMLAKINIHIKTDANRFRPVEVEVLVCDYSKAKNEIGYNPRIPLTKTLIDEIEYLKSNPQFLDIERH